MTDLADVRSRLDAIAEELADIAIERLQAALGDPAERVAAAATEKRITRARRAVEKAAALLGDAAAAAADDD